MLPKIAELEFEEVLENEENRPLIGKSFLFDFKKGDFVLIDGKLVPVYGIEALKVWIEKTIRTERFKFRVYEGTEYGVMIEDLIGSNFPLDFIKIELEREITDSLLEHPAINNIVNFSVEQTSKKTIISFEVITDFENFEQEVELDGA